MRIQSRHHKRSSRGITDIGVRVSQLKELTLGLLDSLGDLARVAEVLVGIELDPELDGLAAEEVGVDVPVLGSLERPLV